MTTSSSKDSKNSSHTTGPQGEFSHRPIVWGTRAMVGAGTQLTAQSGMRILDQGGNAVDATVASAAPLVQICTACVVRSADYLGKR